MSKSKYGFIDDGPEIVPPKGWKIIPEGYEVPQIHREFTMLYDGRHNTWDSMWLDPRSCRSTMTPIWACVWGWKRAYAVPEGFDISTLKNHKEDIERNKSYKGVY